jgi:hypothetical protein
MNHYNIVFATPGRDVKMEYLKSLLETVKWVEDEGLSWTFVSKYSSFVPSARELTSLDSYYPDWSATAFGGGNFTYDRIFWIDSDISWAVDDFVRLLGSDKDIIAGLMPVDKSGRVGVSYWDSEGRPTLVRDVEFILEDSPVKVGAVSFGFLAVRQGVFEAMKRPWFQIRSVNYEGADFPVNLGEDYSWCVGAAEAGFDIWVDPLVRVEHHKETILRVNL